jgi:hypothetical protein
MYRVCGLPGTHELGGKKTGHRYFEKDHVKITLPGHGPGDLTKKHVGMIGFVKIVAGPGGRYERAPGPITTDRHQENGGALEHLTKRLNR